jgi:ribosomal protein S18 acetylase RimI-like enzyme
VIIREARAAELAAVGQLRLDAYAAAGVLSAGYADELRALGTAGDGTVLVADVDGQLTGSIMLVLWPCAGELIAGPEEAEVRALAVPPGTQRGGVGMALLRATMTLASAAGARRMVLCTMPQMLAAHRLYQRAGFSRLPERDWSPRPELKLLAYSADLAIAS